MDAYEWCMSQGWGSKPKGSLSIGNLQISDDKDCHCILLIYLTSAKLLGPTSHQFFGITWSLYFTITHKKYPTISVFEEYLNEISILSIVPSSFTRFIFSRMHPPSFWYGLTQNSHRWYPPKIAMLMHRNAISRACCDSMGLCHNSDTKTLIGQRSQL